MWFMWQSGKTVHLKDYLRIIQKKSGLIVTACLATFLFTFVLNQIMSPVYRAETRLLVEEKLQDVNLTRNMLMPYQKEFFETQRQILESNPVFEAAVINLELHQKTENANWMNAIKDRFKNLLGLNYSLSEDQLLRDTIEKAIKRMRKQVNIESLRGTNIIVLQVEGKDPESVRDQTNALASAFIQRSLNLKNKDSREASQYLKNQLGSIQDKLEASEKKLEEFQFTKEAISLDKRIEFLVEKQLVVAEKEHEDAILELEQEREKVEVLHAQVNNERAKKSVGDRGTLKLLTEQQLLLELKLNELKRKFTNQHPEVVALRKSLDLLLGRIKEQEKQGKAGEQQAGSEFLQSLEKEFSEAQRNYRVNAVREQQLRDQLERYRKKLQGLLAKKSEFLVLQREMQANEKLYELVLQKEKQVGVESTLNVGHIKQVAEATLPVYPVKPKKLLNLVVSIFVGILLGIGMAFLQEYMDLSLKTREELIGLLGDIPLLGVLQEERWLKKELHLLPTLCASNPNSALGEAFKILKANLQLYLSQGQNQFLVTSSLPSEGKSTVASNLAITFARSGKQVLLMDCDLRKPKIHQHFQTVNQPDNTLKTQIEGLFLWRAPSVHDPTVFIENEFPKLLEKYGKQFDLVLIDSAPVNLVADTATLLRKELPVLFVMGAGVATEPEIQRAFQIFDNMRVKISGAIISRLDEGLASQDYNSYYESYFS